jgi:membrane protein DedA with SNARE-associated domain
MVGSSGRQGEHACRAAATRRRWTAGCGAALVSDWARDLMEDFGYLGVVLLMAIENLFPSIPSEVVMPLAGYTATTGAGSLLGMILAGMAGSVLGALPLYWAGRAVGRERLEGWASITPRSSAGSIRCSGR